MLIFPSLLGGKDWSSELTDWRSLYDGLLHAYYSRLDGRLPTKSQCWSNESCHRISYDDLSRSQYVFLTQSLMFWRKCRILTFVSYSDVQYFLGPSTLGKHSPTRVQISIEPLLTSLENVAIHERNLPDSFTWRWHCHRYCDTVALQLCLFSDHPPCGEQPRLEDILDVLHIQLVSGGLLLAFYQRGENYLQTPAENISLTCRGNNC